MSKIFLSAGFVVFVVFVGLLILAFNQSPKDAWFAIGSLIGLAFGVSVIMGILRPSLYGDLIKKTGKT